MKELLRSFFKSIGFEVRRYQTHLIPDLLLIKMLKEHDINLLFDIGANYGHFSISAQKSGYEGKIVSFEPLSSAYKKLLTNNSNSKSWIIAPQMAIGAEDGEIEINISDNSESSSILGMLDSHSDAAGNSRYIGKEKVSIRKLDSVTPEYLDSQSRVFLKIDTQGYEDRVLRGAAELLKNTIGIQLELSLIPLYDGQKLYLEMISELNSLGFELWSVNPVFNDPQSGRLLQIDATFFRKSI